MTVADVISGVGVILTLTAFLLSTLDRMSTESRIYFMLNLCGGVMAALGAWLLGSYPFLVMEAVWAIVAAGGLFKTYSPSSISSEPSNPD